MGPGVAPAPSRRHSPWSLGGGALREGRTRGRPRASAKGNGAKNGAGPFRAGGLGPPHVGGGASPGLVAPRISPAVVERPAGGVVGGNSPRNPTAIPSDGGHSGPMSELPPPSVVPAPAGWPVWEFTDSGSAKPPPAARGFPDRGARLGSAQVGGWRSCRFVLAPISLGVADRPAGTAVGGNGPRDPTAISSKEGHSGPNGRGSATWRGARPWRDSADGGLLVRTRDLAGATILGSVVPPAPVWGFPERWACAPTGRPRDALLPMSDEETGAALKSRLCLSFRRRSPAHRRPVPPSTFVNRTGPHRWPCPGAALKRRLFLSPSRRSPVRRRPLVAGPVPAPPLS